MAPSASCTQCRGRIGALADAARTGTDPERVRDAVDAAADELRDAPVQNFVGVLVERSVREDLDLPRSHD